MFENYNVNTQVGNVCMCCVEMSSSKCLVQQKC